MSRDTPSDGEFSADCSQASSQAKKKGKQSTHSPDIQPQPSLTESVKLPVLDSRNVKYTLTSTYCVYIYIYIYIMRDIMITSPSHMRAAG